MRISGLVLAIKGFTHMDQATVAEPVDLPISLSNTVDVLKAKARKKSIAISARCGRAIILGRHRWMLQLPWWGQHCLWAADWPEGKPLPDWS